MIIYSLRYSDFEALSFYQICRDIFLLEQKGIPEDLIEIALTAIQFDSLKPVIDLIAPQPAILPKNVLGFLGETKIRLLEG